MQRAVSQKADATILTQEAKAKTKTTAMKGVKGGIGEEKEVLSMSPILFLVGRNLRQF